jgi:short-subunit dehydrogenase
MLAVVTGASAGIGVAFAKHLTTRGYDLLIAARREERLTSLAQELSSIGRKIHTLAVDLAKIEDCTKLFEAAKKIGPVDLLVNNAGVGFHGALAEQDPARVLQMLQLNIDALSYLTALFLPEMVLRKSGAIIQVCSTGAFQPIPYMAAYAASKAFVLSFTEALSVELKGTGVSVQTLCPGATSTEFNSTAGVSSDVAGRAPSYMTPEAVVEASLKGLDAGKTLVIPGFLNRQGAFWASVAPRRLATRLAGRLFKPSKEKALPQK